MMVWAVGLPWVANWTTRSSVGGAALAAGAGRLVATCGRACWAVAGCGTLEGGGPFSIFASFWPCGCSGWLSLTPTCGAAVKGWPPLAVEAAGGGAGMV